MLNSCITKIIVTQLQLLQTAGGGSGSWCYSSTALLCEGTITQPGRNIMTNLIITLTHLYLYNIHTILQSSQWITPSQTDSHRHQPVQATNVCNPFTNTNTHITYLSQYTVSHTPTTNPHCRVIQTHTHTHTHVYQHTDSTSLITLDLSLTHTLTALLPKYTHTVPQKWHCIKHTNTHSLQGDQSTHTPKMTGSRILLIETAGCWITQMWRC